MGFKINVLTTLNLNPNVISLQMYYLQQPLRRKSVRIFMSIEYIFETHGSDCVSQRVQPPFLRSLLCGQNSLMSRKLVNWLYVKKLKLCPHQCTSILKLRLSSALKLFCVAMAIT